MTGLGDFWTVWGYAVTVGSRVVSFQRRRVRHIGTDLTESRVLANKPAYIKSSPRDLEINEKPEALCFFMLH
jgi:hypothetical protein